MMPNGVPSVSVKYAVQPTPGTAIFDNFRLEANGPWTVVYEGGRAQTLIGGLVSGQEYFFRVRCVGSSGLGTLSDITKTRAA